MLRHTLGGCSPHSSALWQRIVQASGLLHNSDNLAACSAVVDLLRAPAAPGSGMPPAEAHRTYSQAAHDGSERSPDAAQFAWLNRVQSRAQQAEKESGKDTVVQRRLLQAGIVGAPNAGKSSLVNKLAERKVAAVSPRTNTTSAARLAAFTDGNDTQIALYDTPGVTDRVNSPQQGTRVQGAWQIAGNCDVVLFIVDAARQLLLPDPRIVRLAQQLPARLQMAHEARIAEDDALQRHQEAAQQRRHPDGSAASGAVNSDAGGSSAAADSAAAGTSRGNAGSERELPDIEVALVLNKVDVVAEKQRLLYLATTLQEQSGGAFKDIFYTSALHGKGLPELREFLFSRARPSEWLPEDTTDPVAIASELAVEVVKEQLFQRIDGELPYVLEPITTEAREFVTGDLLIKQTIFVPRKEIRGILLGAQGRMIGEIGIAARKVLERELKKKVHLFIQVLIRKDDASETSQLMVQHEA